MRHLKTLGVGLSALAVLNCSQSSPSYASSSLKLIKLKQVVELTLRYNEVRDTFEFKVLNPEMGGSLTNTDFVPLQDEALNSIILEAMKAGIEGKLCKI